MWSLKQLRSMIVPISRSIGKDLFYTHADGYKLKVNCITGKLEFRKNGTPVTEAPETGWSPTMKTLGKLHRGNPWL